MSPATGGDRLQEERHNANLTKFRDIDADLKENTKETKRALSEVQSVRHDVRNLRQLVDDFVYLYREEKKDRKADEEKRSAAMDKQAEELRKLSNKVIWATGAIAGISMTAHWVFDLLSPITRHILGQ